MRALCCTLTTLLMASGCYLFTDENRPCTTQGDCLPGFTCVDGLCVTASAKKVGDVCRETGECVDGLVCAVAFCDDSDRRICEAAGDCGDTNVFTCREGACRCIRHCQQGCTFPDSSSCGNGKLCFLEAEQDLGFCHEGECGERSDGTPVGACRDTDVCLEFNGPGSGLCTPMCTVLEQNLGCNESQIPPGVLCCAGNQNCEHVDYLWGSPVNPSGELGICFESGPGSEGATCSNLVQDNLFCAKGLFCDGRSCRRYCQRTGGAPACNGSDLCNAFPAAPANIPFGYCQSQ